MRKVHGGVGEGSCRNNSMRRIRLQFQACHSDPYFHKHHVLLLGRINELYFRMHLNGSH